MGEMGNRPGGGDDFGRAKRRRQDLEIARGGSREIGEGVGLRRSTYQCKGVFGSRVEMGWVEPIFIVVWFEV